MTTWELSDTHTPHLRKSKLFLLLFSFEGEDGGGDRRVGVYDFNFHFCK